MKRSSTAIVLKNLPYEAEESDLRAMCERFGGLARLALPDTKAIAVAEWLEPADARKAFKGLAYKRYKHVPIYVEWAPEGVFSGDAPKVSAAPGKTPRADGGGRGAAAAEMRDKLLSAASPEDDGDEEATKIFVKGLSFQTRGGASRAFSPRRRRRGDAPRRASPRREVPAARTSPAGSALWNSTPRRRRGALGARCKARRSRVAR